MAHDPEHHRNCSEFIRSLVQTSDGISSADKGPGSVPRVIVQYWDDLSELPNDIRECIASWARWAGRGFTHRLFEVTSALDFIRTSLDEAHERAFLNCYHPAMQSDYFRLCYLFIEGGFYVDADDEYIGAHIDWLFDDGRLKLQPLCYDIASGGMVKSDIFLKEGAFDPHWIFYFNNNPIIVGKRNRIIEQSLIRSTALLQSVHDDNLPDIQDTTGPGNLSKLVYEVGPTLGPENRPLVLREWETVAVSRWPLSHRCDARNWRNSNKKRFYRMPGALK